jgi:hypothetical protein
MSMRGEGNFDFGPPKWVTHVIVGLAIVVATVFGLGILIVFSALLLSYAEITQWPNKPTLAVLLTVASLGLAMFSAIVWFLANNEVLRFKPDAVRLIGRVLIASILASVAFGVAGIYKGA